MTVRRQSRRGALALRATLVLFGFVVALVLVEATLAILQLPRSYVPQKKPLQFASFPSEFGSGRDPTTGAAVYVNRRADTIRFVYDGDPRGYFGRGNAIDHVTNALGFRGPEFALAIEGGRPVTNDRAGRVRLAFLGDSFTFGEGVRFEDTYPERAASLLAEELARIAGEEVDVEAYNFGVGGHNTTQTLYVLDHLARYSEPDAVVVGYVLNDAEPPLYVVDDETATVRRRPRPIEPMAVRSPSDSPLYRLRSSRLVDQLIQSRRLSRATEAHYHALFADDSEGWRESQRALRDIAALCRVNDIRLVVVLFPVLERLDDGYPFRAAHEKVRFALADTDAVFVDLLPMLIGTTAEALWVHPTDSHPNERVHAVAAEAIANALAARAVRTEGGGWTFQGRGGG